jgi:hypothetical protein
MNYLKVYKFGTKIVRIFSLLLLSPSVYSLSKCVPQFARQTETTVGVTVTVTVTVSDTVLMVKPLVFVLEAVKTHLSMSMTTVTVITPV